MFVTRFLVLTNKMRTRRAFTVITLLTESSTYITFAGTHEMPRGYTSLDLYRKSIQEACAANNVGPDRVATLMYYVEKE